MSNPNISGFLPQPITLNEEQTDSIRLSILAEHGYPVWMRKNNDGIYVYSQNVASQICDFDPASNNHANDVVRTIDMESTPGYSALATGLIKGMMAGNNLWRELDFDVRYMATATFFKRILSEIGIDVTAHELGILETDDIEALRDLHAMRMGNFNTLSNMISSVILGAENAVSSVESYVIPDASVSRLFRTAAIVGIGAAASHRTAVDLKNIGLSIGIPLTDEAIQAAFG